MILENVAKNLVVILQKLAKYLAIIVQNLVKNLAKSYHDLAKSFQKSLIHCAMILIDLAKNPANPCMNLENLPKNLAKTLALKFHPPCLFVLLRKFALPFSYVKFDWFLCCYRFLDC